jgi:hypothetical protein
MSLTKLECPECGKVLKPARPVEPGKKVRCPKCQAVFIAGGDEDEQEEGVEAGAEKAPKKKQAASAAKGKPEAKKAAAAGSEEEEEGAYSLIRDEEDEENKPKISYAPDTSIKDLRGPAVAALMSPTNWLIRSGFIGVFGCLATLLLLGIPALLPVKEDDNPEGRPAKPMMKIDKGFGKGNPMDQGQGIGPGNVPPPPAQEQKKEEKKEKMQEDPPAAYVVYGYDWGSLCDLRWYVFLVMMIPFILLGCYSGMVAFGGIKAQNLESRGWGIAASIMAMLPLNTFCANVALAIVAKGAIYMVLDVDDGLTVFLVMVWYFISHLIFPLSLGSGIWTLVTLNKPEVLAGYEYEGE